MPRKRLTKEKTTELISRNQFEEMISNIGWTASGIDPDLGEDIIVNIFRNGVSTGISFQVQIKSTNSIKKYQLSDGTISYQFDTDDLLHWNIQMIPVVIVIWDITKRSGWAITIDEVIRKLDTANINWRNQQYKQIRIPVNSKIDKDYLLNLSTTFTKKYSPTILGNKDLTINGQFTFPDTEEGKNKLAEYNKFLKTGEPVNIQGDFIEKWELPDEWKRIFGEIDPKSMRISIEPIKSSETIPTSIKFVSTDRNSVEFDYIKFQKTKEGSEEITLSNVDQDIPIKIIIVLNKTTLSSQFHFRFLIQSMSIEEALKVVQLQEILATGGTFYQKFLETGFEHSTTFPGSDQYIPNKTFEIFIKNVNKLQNQQNLNLHFRDNILFTYEDFRNSNRLISIFDSGIYEESNLTSSVEINKKSIEELYIQRNNVEWIRFSIEEEESSIYLLDEEFRLGPMKRYINGQWSRNDSSLQNWLKTANHNDFYSLQLINVSIKEEYQDFISQ